MTGAWTFAGVKRPRRDVDHPSKFRAEFKERVELYLVSPLLYGEVYLYLYLSIQVAA